MKFRRIGKTGVGLLAVASSVFFLAGCKKQVTLSPTDIALNVGETEVVTAKVTRGGKPQVNVTVAFETADANVATVSPPSADTNADGEAEATVRGESPGSTTVTARAEGMSASTDVTVSDGQPQPCVTHEVILQNFRFNPDALTINACDTVTWVHQQGNIPHTVTSGNLGDDDAGAIFDSRGGDPDARMRQGDTFSHTFADPETFPYHCVVHANGGMTGTVTVNPNP